MQGVIISFVVPPASSLTFKRVSPPTVVVTSFPVPSLERALEPVTLFRQHLDIHPQFLILQSTGGHLNDPDEPIGYVLPTEYEARYYQ